MTNLRALAERLNRHLNGLPPLRIYWIGFADAVIVVGAILLVKGGV